MRLAPIELIATSFEARPPREVNFDNGLSLGIEKNRARRRTRPELIGTPGYRTSRAGIGAHYVLTESFGIDLSGSYERRGIMAPGMSGRSSKHEQLRIAGVWHGDDWRLSAGYQLLRSFKEKSGLDRSIQIAAGGQREADRMALALDYDIGSVARAMRIGIEAHSDHVSAKDAQAMAMPGRSDNVVALHMAFGL